MLPWFYRFRLSWLAVLASLVLATPTLGAAQELPPDEAGAEAHLDASPRHGEWVDYPAGDGDQVRAWVVYPERSGPAPVVVVIHEIYALTDWIRGVADQLAAEGFIAIAPDLISGKGPDGGGSESVDRQGAVALIRALDPQEVTRRLKAAAAYATGLPSATEAVGVVGYCWGGSTSFRMATEWPELGGSARQNPLGQWTLPQGPSPAAAYRGLSGGTVPPGAQRRADHSREPLGPGNAFVRGRQKGPQHPALQGSR